MYTVSNSSGDPQVGTSGTGNRGTITAGTLEMSNVDLSQEFTNMIVAQRGFQANSKTIMTADQMLSDLVNLRR
jgi:flagellar hook protein FlgE